MPTRQLVFADGSSDKFWNIELHGESHTVNFGRVGTNGQTKTKDFDSAAAARKSFDKLVEQKLNKGYVDAGGTAKKAVAHKKAATKKAVPKKKTAKTATTSKTSTSKTSTSKTSTTKASKKKASKKKASKKKAGTKKAGTKKGAAANETSCQLVFDDAKSSKFWHISLDGAAHTVNFGRQGTQGQSKTKEFDSEDAARTSFDKLIAEKRRKGYVEGSGAAAAVAPASTAAKRQVSTQPAEPEPAPEVDLTIAHEIDLDPQDWILASFRKRAKLDRGQPPAADVDAAAERLAGLRTERYGWGLPWEKLKLGPILAREDAHFWLYAMTQSRGRLDSKAAVQKFATKIRKAAKFDGKISLQEATKRVLGKDRGVTRELMIPLFSLFSAEQCLEIMLTPDRGTKANHEMSEQAASLQEGFRLHVVPYLTQKEITALQQRVRETFDPTAESPDEYTAFPLEHYLAASLGMHKDVLKVTSSWDDDRYSKGEDWTDHYQNPQDLLFGLGSAELVESEWRRLRLKINDPEEARGFLACTEFSALDVLAECICKQSNKEECGDLLGVLTLVRAPEVAEPMLNCRLSSKTPAVARDWMDKYVGNCVAGLIETAGQRGKLADAAIDYLRGVKRAGQASLISRCVKQAGKKSDGAARVQKDVLDHVEKVFKPMDAKTTPKWLKQAIDAVTIAKPPKLPRWASPSSVPALTVGDARLNDEQMQTVLQVLAVTPIRERHPLLEGIKEHVDKQARDDFAWQMFQLWQEDGANAKDKWAMGTIGHLGDDGCVLNLTPMVRAWPGESQHARAVFGLECLRGVGSSTALMQLSGIAQKLKFKGLKAKAAAFVEEIAKEHGMTRAELEDRVVPDCGLDEMGRREFSFGPRSFSFVLGGDLKPMVRDENGKVRPNPPAPGVKDDKKLANESLAEWKLIKKQIKDVAVLQSGRLEQAMVTGRRWSVDDFESLLVRHPLMTHLVQKLIWGAFDKKGKRQSLFRVTEERDYADAKDNTCSLAKADAIGLVHPLEMSEAERATWGDVLSDYEIISPFPQLGREVYSLDKGEDKAKELKRFHGLSLYAPTMVFTLEKLGWTRGEAMDAGCFDEHSKQFPSANVTAVVGYDGTVGMGYIDPEEMLKTDSIHFCAGMREPSGYRWGSKKTMKLGDVPEIVISEVLADLQVLKSKAK